MSLTEYVDALESTWTGLAAACEGLSEPEWQGPTDLPGWTVKDNVAHVASIEGLLLGEPYPTHELPDLPHVRNDFARFMEVPVDVRRSWSGEEVLAELRSVTDRRLAALRSLPEEAFDEEAEFLGGKQPLRRILGIRVFDCWTHEQDVRRAVRRPGGLTSPAGQISWKWMLRGLRTRAEVVPALAGRSVLVTTTGATELAATLSYGAPPDAEPDVRVSVDFDTFARLVCGRMAYDLVASTVALSGDVALGEELLRNAAITP